MNKKRILFVCMGNICRSPAAEAIMKKIIEKNILSDKIEIDSAGTIEYHSGESADSRMIEFAKKRGYEVDSIARQFDMTKDFKQFDYIVTMYNENLDDIKSIDIMNKHKHKIFIVHSNDVIKLVKIFCHIKLTGNTVKFVAAFFRRHHHP